jgi:hypothetical protein
MTDKHMGCTVKWKLFETWVFVWLVRRMDIEPDEDINSFKTYILGCGIAKISCDVEIFE